MSFDQSPHPAGISGVRNEDPALLRGRAGFLDDLPVGPGTGYIAVVRAACAHGDIVTVDAAAACALPGVHGVFTGAEIAETTKPLHVGLPLDIECRAVATDRVRYIGEPVAVVVAEDRYLAEDAAGLVVVETTARAATVDPRAAVVPDAPRLFEDTGNVVSERRFRYGDPEAAFAAADRVVSIEVDYPRNAVTPIETYGVIASYDPDAGAYDVTANFQGPFSIHTVIARALGVPGNRLRLRTPPSSGGSFGVKQGVFPYIVLACAAARASGRTVKWVEDRAEHLMASVSATNRVTTLRAAVEADGRVTALDWDQLEDVGAYPRAPEPATLYRMHGNMTGAYAIANLAIRNRVVVTNKCPTGLNRGFGGPQVYFALERLMHEVARALDLPRLDVIRRNLIGRDAFPYRTASGGLYDSGDYTAGVALGLDAADVAELRRRRDAARAEGRLYGIGYAAAVEPSVSNMGYVTTVLTPEARARSGPKNGAQATATVAIDPTGHVSVHTASVPQGQGHRTVLAALVAEVFGLPAERVSVCTDLDTARDAWSIASGNYASRFAAAVAGTAVRAAETLRGRLAEIAAHQLGGEAAMAVFADGRVSIGEADMAFARVAATAHWAPALAGPDAGRALRETAFWSPPELAAPDEDDHVNSSLCHGFIFDVCAVEISRETGAVRIDRYATAHDAGRILHPAMVDGQIRGAFSNAVGAALYEEYAYAPDGSFLSGTLADYLIPTCHEVIDPIIAHMETPSPFTPLGAKGVGEGNCMSTPAAIANAVSDALGVSVVSLPLSPARVLELMDAEEPAAPDGVDGEDERDGGLTGSGTTAVPAAPEEVWRTLLDPDALRRVIPGCHTARRVGETRYEAEVSLGIGPVKGRFQAAIDLYDLDEPRFARLRGRADGPLGSGQGEGTVTLSRADGGTRIDYTYRAEVGGRVASFGARLLDGAAKAVISRFFAALAAEAGGRRSWLKRWLS